jgi:hypothetical protein
MEDDEGMPPEFLQTQQKQRRSRLVVPLMDLWLPILVSAVVLQIVSSFIHMVPAVLAQRGLRQA